MNKKELIVSRISSFPTLPVMTHKLLKALNEPENAAAEIARIIQIDPALTANVLKAANSSYLGFRRPANSLSEATFRLGTKWIFQIAVSSLIYSNLNRPAAGYDMSGEELWRHSLATALMAESLSTLLKIRDSGLIYTAALLHDIGKIVMGEFVADCFKDIQRIISEKNISFELAEEEILGVSHTEIGAILAESWHFPSVIADCIRWHHNPDLYSQDEPAIDVVHIADATCLMEGIGLGRDDLQYRLSDLAVNRLNLSSNLLELAISQTLLNLEDIENMFRDTLPATNVREVMK
ncbi:MAG: HDOD domain-containing protein [bacterium]|jgi:putative nucleotidyltransferase with HDIG domain